MLSLSWVIYLTLGHIMCCGSLFLNPPSWLASLFCFPPEARDELLNPENDTIGILVSTAVEITVGGKTIKPAGGFSSERGRQNPSNDRC